MALSGDVLLSVEAAQALAIDGLQRLGSERVGLADALDRVIAAEVTSAVDAPAWPNSAMDGYAVRAGDGTRLHLVGESAAGAPLARSIGPGEAAAIMTGAVVPDGADAVVMVEDTERDGDWVTIRVAPRVGQHIRQVGEDLRTGQVIAVAGSTIGPAELGLLAAARRGAVTVARRPIVAIVSTGDELRELDEPLGPGDIADSNSLMLAALVQRAGGVPLRLPLVGDDRDALRAALSEAASADLVVSTGGVSVGAHDHVKEVVASLGGVLTAWRVDMKPGKPVAFARLGQTPFFGLPGNPVSSFVAFWLFVRPALRALLGARQPFDLPKVQVRLLQGIRSPVERRHYVRATVAVDAAGSLTALPMSRQGSHQLTSAAGANALVVVPAHTELVSGGLVDALVFAPISAT